MSLQLHAMLLTLYPEMFPATLGFALAGKALEKRVWGYQTLQMRDFARDKHRTVDDTPAGGGAGLVMRADIIGQAIEAGLQQARTLLPDAPPVLLYMSPRGAPLTQARVHKLVEQRNLVILCGRFEGIDQRLLDVTYSGDVRVEEIAVGDVVLSGGEVAAQLMLDAAIRLIPDVMGAEASAEEESFALSGDFAGLLEYPQYTRPAQWQGMSIPDVLTSGHHARIRQWRLEMAQAITRERRPDLWAAYQQQLKAR